MWWGFFFAEHSEEEKLKGLSILIRLIWVSSLVSRPLRWESIGLIAWGDI